MRDYGKVSGKFWTGETGKKLIAAGHEALVVALYLMTSPHANMIGLYYLPLIYLAHDTGLGIEGASKGLASAIEAGFCAYDQKSECVFVHAMAKYQIAEALKPDDKRCKGVENEIAKLPKGALVQAFHDRYAVVFNLATLPESPSKPLRSQEQEQEQEAEKQPSSSAAPNDAEPSVKRQERGQRLAAVTDDAIEAFNASKLVKPHGGALATVSAKVGRESRQRQVQRCIAVARQICAEDYQADGVVGEFWADYWAVAHADDFHSGRQRGGKGHENWSPDFEFLTRPATMLKLYDRATAETPS
ncbi:hypothetical protein [Lysobacter sp. P5_B9]